jgi:hypothetical protein
LEGLEGELKVSVTTPRVKTYVEGATRDIVTADQSQTLTNKTIDADNNTISDLELDNLKAGVLNTSTSLSGASDTQVPSALAVKTYVDNSTGAVQTDVDDLVLLSGVAANATTLGTFTGTIIPDNQTNKQAFQALETFAETDATNLANHLSDTTDAHDASAISVVPTGNLAADDVQEALVELQGDIDTINTTSIPAKVTGPASATDNAVARYDLTTGKLIQNSVVIVGDTGAVTGVTDLTASGTVQAGTTTSTAKIIGSESNDAATGSNATLTSPASPEVRLTSGSLVSVDMIPAGTGGQIIILTNATGSAVTINDNTGGTAANRILTGTKAALNLADEATLILKYDATEARWMVIGGTGAGGGAALSTVFQLDATEQLSTWATGDNATFLGGGSLSGTFAKNTSTPLNGLASYQYTQAAGSLDDYLASPAQVVPVRFRGNVATVSFPYLYDGASSDIEPIVWDATNGARLTSVSNLLPSTGTNASIYTANVVIPSNCASIRFGFQVKAVNSGKILQFDDVVLSSDTTMYASTITTQTARISQTASFGNADITGALTSTSGQGLFTYNSGTGIYTALTNCIFTITATFRASGATSVQALIADSTASIEYGTDTSIATVGARCSASATINLTAGMTVKVRNALANTTNEQYISVSAISSSPVIVTAAESFSTDTASLVYAGSATYTLSTLANAPVGTFITFTYATSTNTRTQTNAAAPTQTTSSMGINGFLVTPRAYNATSTSALPCMFSMQIGKGMKGVSTNVYKSTGKSIGGSLDFIYNGAGTQYGALVSYDETSGILTVDSGLNTNAGGTAWNYYFSDATTQANGYIVVNASKSPALVGVPQVLPRFATIQDVKSAGTVGGAATAGAWTTHTLNTLVDSTGIVTSLSSNQFVLQPGTYNIFGDAQFFRTNECKVRIQNITAGTSVLIGESGYSDATNGGQHSPIVCGEIVITAASTFELQWRVGTTKTINGLGVASNFGVNEVYATVQIQKIK